jgi:hypothetical protein
MHIFMDGHHVLHGTPGHTDVMFEGPKLRAEPTGALGAHRKMPYARTSTGALSQALITFECYHG